MTAIHTTPSTVRRGVPAPDGATAAGAAVALGCTLVGTFVETPWKPSGTGEWGVEFGSNGGWTALAVLVAFTAVGTFLVGLATDRARAVPPERTARRALVLAGLGVGTLVVFWTGMPAILAGGSVGLALDARRRLGRLPAPAAVAISVAALTVVGAVYAAFTG
jgi:hypothetical protein